MSDRQIEQIRRYVDAGGRLCIIGPAASCDQWMRPRSKPGLEDVPADRVVRVASNGDWLKALSDACPAGLSLSVTTAKVDSGLCCELTEQPNRRLVHLVNYRSDGAMEGVTVRLAVPQGRSVSSVTLASPEHDDRSLSFTKQDGTVTFTVPRVNVYEIAVVALK